MNEYQRMKELIEKYENPPEDQDLYTEAGLAQDLDDGIISAKEEAFMRDYNKA